MLKSRQYIKPSKPTNVTYTEKITGVDPVPIDMGSDKEYSYRVFNKKNHSLGKLSRKKRSDETTYTRDITEIGLLSNMLTFDKKLKLMWYGENGQRELNIDSIVFKEKIQQLIRNSFIKYPDNEKFESLLKEKPYPTDYELGYFSMLVYRADAGYEIIGLTEENLDRRLKEIEADFHRLEEYLKTKPREREYYEDAKQILLTEQFTLLKRKSLVGWRLVGMASNSAMNNGYVGAIYWNASKKHIVIAHRGTEPSNLGSDWSDIKGIVANLEVAQMGSANTFSWLIFDSLPESIKSISFTGHSLGGWLAQITTFSSEYLEREDSHFKKRVQPSHYHPHTVVFDSPGSQPMLLKLKRNFDLRYVTSIRQDLNINTLDIRIYLSAPNMINTCNSHVGTIYRLFPDLKNSLDRQEGKKTDRFTHLKNIIKSFVTDKLVLYTLRAHKLQRMLNAWPRDEDRPTPQEVQEVQDWPIRLNLIGTHEYDEFFLKVKSADSYHTDESAITRSGFRVRYRTRPIDFSSTTMRIFSAKERQCLNFMKILQDWFIEQKGSLTPELHDLSELNQFFENERLEESVITKIMHAFKAYTLVDYGEKLQARETEGQITPVIIGLKQLLRRYPDIVDVVKREVEKRPTLIQAIYVSESDHWINRLRDRVDLRWNINHKQLNLVDFLTNKEAKVLHIVVDVEEIKPVMSQLVYELLMAIGEKKDNFFSQLSEAEKVGLEPYAHSNTVAFLSVDQIRLQQVRNFDINTFYKNDKSTLLLCLDGELTHEDNWQIALFNGSLTKKIIVLTKAGGLFFHFLKNRSWAAGIYHSYQGKMPNWSDLTLESRQYVLEKVTVQKDKSLARLIGFDMFKDISPDTFNEKLIALDSIFNDKTLINLINNKIDIGSIPESATNIDATYVKAKSTLVANKLTAALLKDFINEEVTRYIFVSGLFNSDINVAKEQFVRYLGLSSRIDEAEKIKSKIDFYDISESIDKRIFIVDDSFTEIDFKEFCRNYNPLELKVDWIYWENNRFILQYFYNTDFYIDRKFYYKSKIIIFNNIKEENVSVQIGNDWFIFFDIEFNGRSTFLIRVQEILKPFKPKISEYILDKFKKNEKVNNILLTLVSHDREALFKSLSQMGSIHWLKQDSQNQLIWHRSTDSLEPLISYIDQAKTNSAQEILSEKDFINKVSKSTALIIDEPGMGKTTVLMKLSRTMLESNWVIFISPRIFEKGIERISFSEKFTFSHAVEFLTMADRSGLSSDLSKKLIRYKLQHPYEGLPLLLLLDGFDEIKENNQGAKNKIISLLNFLKDKAVIWVTSRKNEIKTLKNSLSVFDTQLEELEINDQREFLKKFWHARLFLTLSQSEDVFERKYNIYVEALLKKVNDLIKLDNSHFMGIPLQLQLLGEGFQEEFKIFVKDENNDVPKLENISILNLYEKFIQAKYNIFLEKLKLFDSTLREITINNFDKMYVRLALHQLLGDDAIDLIGIKSPLEDDSDEVKINNEKLNRLFAVGLIQPVGDNYFEFIHASFIEYFAAEFFSRQLTKSPFHRNHDEAQRHLLTNILINNGYQFIRVFLDKKLSKKILLEENLYQYAIIIKSIWLENTSNFYNEQGKTALHVAVDENHQKIFGFLLDIFKIEQQELVDLFSARDQYGDSALYLAVKQNKHHYVIQFLETMKTFYRGVKKELLLSAMFRSNDDANDPVIKKLLDDYINQSEDNEIKQISYEIKQSWIFVDPFFKLIERGDSAAIQNYLRGIDGYTQNYFPLIVNKYGESALFLAIKGQHKKLAEFLIARGSDLHWKVTYGVEIINYNVDHIDYRLSFSPGEDILSYEITPLQLAVFKRCEDIVIELVSKNVEIDNYQVEVSPLYVAAHLNNEAILGILLHAGANSNIQTSTGKTPLYWAAFYDNQEMVDSLLLKRQYQVGVNIQTSDYYTPLYWAVYHGNQDMVIQLINAGAEINVGYGETRPLYAAIDKKNLLILSLLVEKLVENNQLFSSELLFDVIEHLRDVLQLQQEDAVKNMEKVADMIEILFSGSADCDVRLPNGETPLYRLIKYAGELIQPENDNDPMEVLLKQDPDVNLQIMVNGETPLYLAVKKNKLALAQRLLDKGAIVDFEVNEEGIIHTPLSLAKENENEHMVKLLLAQGAQDNIERNIDYLPYLAIRTNNKVSLAELLKNIDINMRYGGKTLLHWAIIYGRDEIVKILLDNDAEANEKTANGDTALYLAIEHGLGDPVKASKVIEILLDRGANINVNLKNGEPLLCWMIRQSVLYKDTLVILKLLLRRHPNVNVLTKKYHRTALYLAMRNGLDDVIEMLLEQDVNIKSSNNDNGTPLYWAVKNSLDRYVDVLLRRGASDSVNVKLKNGETLLYWATRRNSLSIVEKLLINGAINSVNIRLENGETPLYWAVRHNSLNIVEKLLAYGAADSVNVRLTGGETPLYWAAQQNSPRMIEKLLSHGAASSVNVKLDNNETALYWAARHNSLSMVEKLLSHGAADSVNVSLENGETPLYWAVKHNSLAMVEKLLAYDANPSIASVKGMSLVTWAEYYKNGNIINKLQQSMIERSSDAHFKRTHEESEEQLALLKRRRNYYKNLTYCLPGPSGGSASGPGKRSVVTEGCEISWEDVNEFNDEKENPRIFNEIKINSDKFLNILKKPSLSEVKRAQLLQLADRVVVLGESKEQVYQLVRYQKVLMQLNKIGRISGMVMHGMMAKNLLRDFLEEDYEGVALNIGFIGAGQGLARVAKVASIQGEAFVANGRRLLGHSLRIASPFLARGTGVLIAYDLTREVKAYRQGNSDAMVGILGDSIYLIVDGIEIGVELAEIGGLLEGVSSVTGPIGATIGAITFVGTDVYLAGKQVHRIDALVHLTSKEKLIEGLRGLVGMNPERYLKNLLLEKEGNNRLYRQGIAFLKANPNIRRYILPTLKAKAICIAKQTRLYPLHFVSHSLNRRRNGIADSVVRDNNCHMQLELNLDNMIFLNHKIRDIKWSRIKPDVNEGSLLCAPVGNDEEIPSEGVYFCDKAMGIEWSNARTGNVTFLELGDGADTVIGFPQDNHVVVLGSGYKNITLGDGDDIFLLRGNLEADSLLDGRGGINTIALAPHACPFDKLQQTIQIHNYLLRENEPDRVPKVVCNTHYLDTRGGKNDDLGKDQIIISDACMYFLKIAIRSHTHIHNYAGNNGNKFTYIIPTTTNKGNSTVSIEYSQGLHQFLFAYELLDIYQLTKERDNNSNIIKFSFGNNQADISSRGNSNFSVSIRFADENELFYQLRNNTVIKVIKDNFYAFQRINRSVEEIIDNYSIIAERSSNFSIFSHSTLTNESIAIGQSKNDVLSNDPYRRSHLVGNGGENIFVIRSGHSVLDKDKLPIPEIVLYDKDEKNLIDTLDLREIRSQLEKDFDVKIKATVRLVENTNDVNIELFSPKEVEKSLVTVRLKDALLTRWYARLHVILNHAPMVLDDLKLRPLPLNFGPDKQIIVICSEDVEESTTVIIDKRLDDYGFFRLKNNLIITNLLNANLTDYEACTLLLQNFYQTPKLKTLSIEFVDKKIILQDETEKVYQASSFTLKFQHYNQTLHARLFNSNATEKSIRSSFRSRTYRSYHEILDEIKVEETNKSIWNKIASYIPHAVVGIGVIFGGMRISSFIIAASTIYGEPVAGSLPLTSDIETKSTEQLGQIASNSRGSYSEKNNCVTSNCNNNLMNNSFFIKWFLKTVLGKRSFVTRMNRVGCVVTNDPIGRLELIGQRVSKALEKYDRMNETEYFEEMKLLRAVSSSNGLKSNATHSIAGKNSPVSFWSDVASLQTYSNDDGREGQEITFKLL